MSYPQRNSSTPVAVLVLGILSVVGFGFLTGVPAWILGNGALKEWPQNTSEYTMIQIGRIIGMVVSILTIIGFCIFLAFFLGIFGLAAFSTHPSGPR